MTSNFNRDWIHRRLDPVSRTLTHEFVRGVGEFVAFVCAQEDYKLSNGIRCPCVKCRCLKFVEEDDVKLHLYKKGFMPDYEVWIYHGESLAPTYVMNPLQNTRSKTAKSRIKLTNHKSNLAYDKVIDVAGPSFDPHMGKVVIEKHEIALEEVVASNFLSIPVDSKIKGLETAGERHGRVYGMGDKSNIAKRKMTSSATQALSYNSVGQSPHITPEEMHDLRCRVDDLYRQFNTIIAQMKTNIKEAITEVFTGIQDELAQTIVDNISKRLTSRRSKKKRKMV